MGVTCAQAPKAYQLAVDRTGYRREDILFVASAGWDAAGAHWLANAGHIYPYRNGEELEVAADASGSPLPDLTPLLHLAFQR